MDCIHTCYYQYRSGCDTRCTYSAGQAAVGFCRGSRVRCRRVCFKQGQDPSKSEEEKKHFVHSNNREGVHFQLCVCVMSMLMVNICSLYYTSLFHMSANLLL